MFFAILLFPFNPIINKLEISSEEVGIFMKNTLQRNIIRSDVRILWKKTEKRESKQSFTEEIGSSRCSLDNHGPLLATLLLPFFEIGLWMSSR